MALTHNRRRSPGDAAAPLLTIPASALRAAWRWLTQIDSPDPLRRMLNRGLVPVALLFILLALVAIPGYESPLIAAFLAGYAVCLALALCLNRRGTCLAAAAMTCASGLAVAVLMEPAWYLAPLDQPLYVPAEPLVTVAFAALFIRPWAGVWACGAQIAGLTLCAALRGVQPDAIVNFVLYGSLTLWAVMALVVAGAHHLSAALRRSIAANAELERHVAERTAALAKANALLEAAGARAERTAALRAAEITEVVHDARNQITHISAAAELLGMQLERASVRSDTAARSQQVIATAVRAQQDLLDALLEAALLEAGALQLQTEPSDLAALLECAVAQAGPRFEQWRCVLVVDVCERLPPALCDQRRIARVLQNVLNNALKYTCSYRTGDGRVQIALLRDGDNALIRVTDNGVGIAVDQLAQLGRRFVRAASGALAPEGSGIGLNASIGILALHGGSLRLSSAGLGHGTTAEIRLPLHTATAGRESTPD
jgi:signal transduction histidine kinase